MDTTSSRTAVGWSRTSKLWIVRPMYGFCLLCATVSQHHNLHSTLRDYSHSYLSCYTSSAITEQKYNISQCTSILLTSSWFFLGEEIIARAQGVHVFHPLSLNNQGLIGELYITNFRLSFQTLRFPDYRQEHHTAIHDYWHPWTPGLIDIPLLSIAQLFRLSKSGKRKPFKVGSLKRLLIVCKNFRLETFSFQLSSPSDSHAVASALAGYVYPVEKERLFVYHYGAKNTNPTVGNEKTSLPSFSTRSDWITELKRTETNFQSWRILQANENFHICSSLPRCFVVPFAVGEESKLENLCAQLSPADERRPLVWTWSYGSASLCRMSGDVDDTWV